jgi:ABC-2 type transport system permease protein
MTAAQAKIAPRSSAASSWWTLYALSLRQQLHGKRWIVMAILLALLATPIVLVRAGRPTAFPPLTLEFVFAFLFIPQAILPLLAMVYASGIIQDDLEEQTITYLLMRPIAKWAIYLLKLAALLTTTAIITAVFTTLIYAVVYVHTEVRLADAAVRCGKAVAVDVLAVSCYACGFGLMSLITRRTLVAGILYTAIFEGLLANLPFSIRLLTVIYYSRLIAYRIMSFVIPIRHGRTADMAAAAWQLDLIHDPQLKEHPQLATCVIVLVSGCAVFAILGALICWQREFYVKTPETKPGEN